VQRVSHQTASRPATDIDPVELAQALIRCSSVTPAAADALDVPQRRLAALGFIDDAVLRGHFAGRPAA
jgi:hypothetical protein